MDNKPKIGGNMEISHLTQSPTRGVICTAGIKRPSQNTQFMGITQENVSLFKMAYLAQKNGESYDGFEKMVGR
jgi:hypothetical protein